MGFRYEVGGVKIRWGKVGEWILVGFGVGEVVRAVK